MPPMKKINVAIISGGNSSEREISLKTGKNVYENLDPGQYTAVMYDTKSEFDKFISDARNRRFDVVFIALHGRGGEDGSVQGLLELLGIPYVGSGVMSSALAMNKIVAKSIFKSANINTPDDYAFCANMWGSGKRAIIKKIEQNVGFPCVIKPNSSGSSVGISISNKDSLVDNINNAFAEDEVVFAEKLIQGKEITVPILQNQALPVVEICPKNKFFDFNAKYDPALCDEIVPARISDKLIKKAQELALRAHHALWCRHYSRVDMLIGRNDKLYVIEVNTLPGFTRFSLFPKSANAAGIEFKDLLHRLIQMSLGKYEA